MTMTFQHQDRVLNHGPIKSAATPQHGQKADMKTAKPQPPIYKPRPAH